MNDKETKKMIIIFLALCLLFIVIIIMQQMNSYKVNSDNIIIPKSMSGLIYPLEDDIVILKLDTTNARHIDLLKRIQSFCSSVGIDECSWLPFLNKK